MKDYILIDMDGTMIDSNEGITKSVQYALKEKGIIVEDLNELTKHIGPPQHESFNKFWGFEGEELEEIIQIYRKAFADHGVFQYTVYPGVEELFEKLYKQGKKIIIVTSKIQDFALYTMENTKLDQYVVDTCGSTFDNSRLTKSDVMKYALEKNNITDKKRAIMIGDRHHDIESSVEYGLESIGVLYGFGSRKELEEAGATYIVETVIELEDLLLSF